METSVVILIIVVVLIVLAIAGYFAYKYVIEPRFMHPLDHSMHPLLHNEHGMHHDMHHDMHNHSSHASMAGHLSRKMAMAKQHSNQAVGHIQTAKHHLNQAQRHAHS